MSPQLVQTPPLSALDKNYQPVEYMVEEVASIIGGDLNDPPSVRRAEKALDRAADRVNMAGIFMYRQKEKVYEDLTLGQSTLSLPDDWGWPTGGGSMAYDADVAPIGPLIYLPWDQFRLMVGKSGNNSVPRYVSIRSEYDNELHIWPHINTADVSSLNLYYYSRIQHPSEDERIALMPETREALITGGQAIVVRFRHLKNPQIWRPMFDDFDRMIEGAKAASNRWLGAAHMSIWPDLDGSGIPINQNSMNPGAVYIRVGN